MRVHSLYVNTTHIVMKHELLHTLSTENTHTNVIKETQVTLYPVNFEMLSALAAEDCESNVTVQRT